MELEWKLFADLKEHAGRQHVAVTVADGDTVADAVDALVAAEPSLEPRVFDDAGGVKDHLNVLRNGESTSLDEAVVAGDELALFPPVSGG